MANYSNSRDRYSLLIRPGADADGNPAPSQQYAAFLRDKERLCGPEGYVDSGQVRHEYTMKKQQKEQQQQQQQQQHSDGTQQADNEQNRGDSTDRDKPLTAVQLTARKNKDDKDFNKRLKVVEEHMWQHKQSERELKRAEGDVVKNQRSLQYSMRDEENVITKKKMEDEKKLRESLNSYTQDEHHQRHNKGKLSRLRAEQDATTEQQHKDHGRKGQVNVTRLSRQYKEKLFELELKRKEANRVSQDFESKLRQKEEEQFRLKQELAELAIELNMESQKGRTQEHTHESEKKKTTSQRQQQDSEMESKLENKRTKEDSDVKAAEANRRKMSAQLTLTKAHLSLKQREEGRKKQDIENRLQANAADQKQMNEAALHARLELQARQSEQKVQDHNARKKALAERNQQDKKEKSQSADSHYSQKAERNRTEEQRQEYEDYLRHSQKMVSRGEQHEYQLYNQVKDSEYKRQKQEQSVRRLQNRLLEMRRQHAAKLQSEMAECARDERDIELKLQREQAELAKSHAHREEGYYSLQKHREQLRGERYLLSEREREHNRLLRIGERSEATSAQS